MAEEFKESTMSSFVTLCVERRKTTGKGSNRRLRASAIIPAVFYTPKGETIPVQVAEAPLVKVFQTLGRTAVFNLEIDDNGQKITAPALLWDIEFYPIKNRIQHVDFFGVDLEKELKVRVPLEFVGTAKGTKVGGKLEIFFEHIDVLCKPLALPKKITVDIADLDINQSIKADGLPLPEGVRVAVESHATIVSVTVAGADDEAEAK